MRRLRPLRRRIFCGCEGESERGYGTFLHQLVEERGDLHIEAVLLQPGAGDCLAVIERACKVIRRKEREFGAYAFRAVFLDKDRYGQNPMRDQQIAPLAAKAKIHLVWQTPSHEALLLHHINGQDNTRPHTSDVALAQLRRHWPEYEKASPARRLMAKFNLDDVLRACRVEPDLREFLTRIRYFDNLGRNR